MTYWLLYIYYIHITMWVEIVFWEYDFNWKCVKWKQDFIISQFKLKSYFFHRECVMKSVYQSLVYFNFSCTPSMPHNSQTKRHTIYMCHSPMKAYNDNLISCMTIHYKTIYVYIMLSGVETALVLPLPSKDTKITSNIRIKTTPSLSKQRPRQNRFKQKNKIVT